MIFFFVHAYNKIVDTMLFILLPISWYGCIKYWFILMFKLGDSSILSLIKFIKFYQSSYFYHCCFSLDCIFLSKQFYLIKILQRPFFIYY